MLDTDVVLALKTIQLCDSRNFFLSEKNYQTIKFQEKTEVIQ